MSEINWPKITVDTPIEEIQRIHKRIWQYVIEHGKKPKTPYICNCVACEYMVQLSHAYGMQTIPCVYCPIDWPDGNCHSYGSPYAKWSKSHKSDDAIAIRDISFKGGSEDV